jgi:hypothetical protein
MPIPSRVFVSAIFRIAIVAQTAPFRLNRYSANVQFKRPGRLMILFALIFKVVPDTIARWRDVWMGSAVTSVLLSWQSGHGIVPVAFSVGVCVWRSGVFSNFPHLDLLLRANLALRCGTCPRFCLRTRLTQHKLPTACVKFYP